MSPRSGAGGATVPGETRVILATVTPSVICDLHLSPCLFWPPHLWRLSLALPCHLCRDGRVCANLTPAHSGARKMRWLCKMLEPDAPHDKCVLCLAKSFPQHPVPLHPPPPLPNFLPTFFADIAIVLCSERRSRIPLTSWCPRCPAFPTRALLLVLSPKIKSTLFKTSPSSPHPSSCSPNFTAQSIDKHLLTSCFFPISNYTLPGARLQ